VFFYSFIIKISKSSKRWSIEEREREKVLKKRKKKEKEKLQEYLQIKEELNILRGEKHCNFKILFV
jgi:hypothetical protein